MYKGTNCVNCSKLILKEAQLKETCPNYSESMAGNHIVRLFDMVHIEPTNPEKPKHKRMTKIEKLVAEYNKLNPHTVKE